MENLFKKNDDESLKECMKEEMYNMDLKEEVKRIEGFHGVYNG